MTTSALVLIPEVVAEYCDGLRRGAETSCDSQTEYSTDTEDSHDLRCCRDATLGQDCIPLSAVMTS